MQWLGMFEQIQLVLNLMKLKEDFRRMNYMKESVCVSPNSGDSSGTSCNAEQKQSCGLATPVFALQMCDQHICKLMMFLRLWVGTTDTIVLIVILRNRGFGTFREMMQENYTYLHGISVWHCIFNKHIGHVGIWCMYTCSSRAARGERCRAWGGMVPSLSSAPLISAAVLPGL